MPRTARLKGEFSTYHIVLRGNERKNIFLADGDRIKFLEILEKMKAKYNFILEAYCLMDNHVHLLINDNGNDISKVIKSINISYAYYFNHTYKRVGHLFQDRFKSELVDNETYLVAVSAYIHNNPVKAAIVNRPEQYKWSSFNSYLDSPKKNINFSITDPQRILGFFSTSKQKAIQNYYDYVLKDDIKVPVLDIEEDIILCSKANSEYIESYVNAQQVVEGILAEKGVGIEELRKNRQLRREIIQRLRKNSFLTLREIGEICGGISQSTVCKILQA